MSMRKAACIYLVLGWLTTGSLPGGPILTPSLEGPLHHLESLPALSGGAELFSTVQSYQPMMRPPALFDPPPSLRAGRCVPSVTPFVLTSVSGVS